MRCGACTALVGRALRRRARLASETWAVYVLLREPLMNPRPLPAIRDQPASVELGRAPSPHTPSHLEEQAGPDWRRVASALLRFKWVVVLMVMLGLGAAFAATRVLRPIYRAQANVWVDVPDQRGNGGSDTRGPIREGALLDADAWVELLRSYIVLDQVVRDLRLYVEVKRPSDRPSFDSFGVSETFRPGDYRLSVGADGRGYTLASAAGIDLERGTLGDSIGSRLGFRWAPPPGSLPPGRTIEFALVPPRDAALRLGEQLDIRMDLNGNFLALELRGPSPVLISGILNAVAQRYVEVAAQLKREKLTELTKILEDQLTTAQRNLDSAETALQGFRTRTITLPSDQGADRKGAAETRDPIRASFFDMQVERDQLRRDRDALERLLAQGGGGDSGLPTDALSAIGSVQRAPELSNALKELNDKQAQLRTYRYHYSEAYPPLQRLVREISELQQRTIPTLARALSTQLATRESELGRQVDASSRDLRQIPGRAIEEVRLSRNTELKEQTYTALQQRFDQARLAAEATVPDVRVLDPAVVPRRPVKNTAPRLLLMGLLAGLGLGVVGAILLDRADPSVRYPEQVSRDLGVPILGAMPHLRAKEPSEVIEALRGLRLNVLHEYGAETPVVMTVTSPGPGDGKSFLSANLALAFADGGHRTLLVDGDIRRGTLHRRFKANRRPGLVDYLRGEAGIGREVIVQETPYPRLAFIGCGTRTQRAPEVLGSPAMTQLLAELRERYDVIVVDSPPLTAGVDPFVLGTATGSLLLVL